ncbi:MAG: glycosyltransferase family 2 protein [Pseudomonadota bacterium]
MTTDTSHNGQALPFRRVYTGMPVYNGEKYLEESIVSNLSQTFDDFGLIIADNASTDRTADICRDYANQDERVVYVRNPQNVGAAGNYAKCFTPANSDYFRWSNADDLIEPMYIAECVEVLDQHPDVVLAYGGTRLIDGEGQWLEDYKDNLHLDQNSAAERFIECRQRTGLSNVLYGLMRRDALSQTALFGNFVASDMNLIAELTLYGKYFEMPETRFSRRMHDLSSSHDRSDENLQRNFWDPSKQRLLMQSWRGLMAYYNAAKRAPIPTGDRRKIYQYLTKTMYWTKGELFAELANYMRFGLLRSS